MWAEGRRAGFGCRLHTSSGMFAGWAALPWQAQKNKLGQMVTWRNREKTTWKIKRFIFVFLSVLLMPVKIFLPVKTGSIGNHLQHVLGEGSVTWQFHARMECSYIGCMAEKDDIHRSLTPVNENLHCQDKNVFKVTVSEDLTYSGYAQKVD